MVSDRPFRFPDDVTPVRDLLVDLFPHRPMGSVWDVRRWDGAIFYGDDPGLAPDRARLTRLWFAGEGRVVAAALSEGGGQIHPHVHPDHDVLLPAVVTWAEEALVAAGISSARLTVWGGDGDTAGVAADRGYRMTDRWEIIRWMHPRTIELPPPRPVPGYMLRPTTDDLADHERIAALLNAAFGRAFHHAGETIGFGGRAPSFRRDLDLVAEAPDGSFAAYAAVCWDAANRHAIFEPVCTHPDHRRRGLARALMLEGMRRATRLGADIVSVGTGDADPANALYASLPFSQVNRGVVGERDLSRR